ncbi:MAG TPA: TfoX/Sxy family protein [Dehalococcoidia bacterium]|nr:TfoX/Sxy family protein [Dehalococcoidia bacterium]
MAYNERLAARIRTALAAQPDVAERKMFGGLAFMVGGKMCVGIIGDDLIMRTGANRYEAALRRPHARPMDLTGRVSRAMVYVAPRGTARADALRRWLDLALTAAAEAAPAKARRARQGKPRA